MINYINGKVKYKSGDSIIVETSGLGFKVGLINASNILLESQIELWIKGYIKDDTYTYYGFTNENEYTIFEKLIKVDGVGPKTALTILAKIPLNELITHIGKGDYAKIKSYGISDKIAKKLVVDMANLDINLMSESGNVPNDAVEALKNLGFQREEIIAKLANIELPTSEDYIKYFLKNR
jgi:Holliday junction DNA helicase RuvA